MWHAEKVSRPSAPPRPRQPVGPVGQRPDRGPGARWRGFARRYGWRAYALPLLAVVTVLALFTTNSPKVRAAIGVGAPHTAATQKAGSSGPPNAAPTGQLKSDDPGAGSLNSVLPALALPPGPAYTTAGKGTYATIPGKSAVIGKGQLYKFSIEVENGVTGVDLKQFASVVMTALSDPRSWTGTAAKALQRVDSGSVDFHITLTSSMTVRNLCGYSLPVETSCFDGADSRVVLNLARWVRGAKAYASDLATYRIYAVNHEVGHALGHNHSHQCLKSGLAPVMMQQTIGDKTASGQICQANPWPYPPGNADAPGAEQAGDGPDMDFYTRNAS
jgi:hypothetical protein